MVNLRGWPGLEVCTAVPLHPKKIQDGFEGKKKYLEKVTEIKDWNIAMKRKETPIDLKVYAILRDYFNGIAEDDEEERLSSEVILKTLRKMRVAEAIDMCQRSDLRLQRVKKILMSAAVEKAFAQIRRDEEENMTHEGTPAIDDEEGDEDNMMEVKDLNQLNKSVVNLWNIPPATPVEDSQTAEASPGATDKKTKEKKSKRKKEKVEKRAATDVSLADLGGIDNIISQVLEMIAMPLSHPEIYAQIGSDIPRGVLLHGPPGCGKTMLANALANELGVAFISVSAPSVVSGMSGESEKKLRDIFDEAKSVAPCLVFIDEIDAITPKRESVQREMERRIVAQLLTCMDDVALEKTDGKPIMIIGATNRPDSIDAALRRGGRFDREICINVPGQESREQILKTICQKLKLSGDFDYKELARMTPGYVGADLNALVAAAGVVAIKRIFKDMQENKILPDISMDVDMDADPATATGEDSETNLADNRSLIKKFLDNHPDPLSEEQLAPLSITFDDFMTALPEVQPSSKREGFATVPDVTWNDVGAMGPVREELEYAIVEPIKNPDLYKAVGISAPSGVLLWGPPGCGKTLLAKAVANQSQANFISVRGPELLNKYVGESERAVRQVFVRARASVPCVIFFDELDALVPHRDDSNSEASSRVVNTLLTELDGVGDRNGVYVIAATNRPDMIDSAMLRPGRLDKQLYVDLPSAHDRAEILRTVTRKSPVDSSIDLDELARDERCRNFSGADLSALTREAAVVALKSHVRSRASGQVVIKGEDFEAALNKVRPSVGDMEREKYRTLNDTWGK